MSSPNISADISLHKVEILNICMKGGEHSPLIQPQMTLKNTSRDVREAAKQLGHGDDAVLNLLKATMPTELYGTLYGHDNLYVVMTTLKDIYAKKPQNIVAVAAGSAQGATAPFTHIRSPTRGAPKAQSDASLEDRILQLTETLYHIDLNGKPTRKPFKPFITQPRRRFKPGHNGHNGCSYSIQWKTLSIRSAWKTTRTKGMLQV